jgi:hypothetical protein
MSKLGGLIGKLKNSKLLTHCRRHVSLWISKMEPQEPGVGAVGIQFEYEWPDAAKTLSKAANPAAHSSNKTAKKNE